MQLHKTVRENKWGRSKNHHRIALVITVAQSSVQDHGAVDITIAHPKPDTPEDQSTASRELQRMITKIQKPIVSRTLENSKTKNRKIKGKEKMVHKNMNYDMIKLNHTTLPHCEFGSYQRFFLITSVNVSLRKENNMKISAVFRVLPAGTKTVAIIGQLLQ